MAVRKLTNALVSLECACPDGPDPGSAAGSKGHTAVEAATENCVPIGAQAPAAPCPTAHDTCGAIGAWHLQRRATQETPVLGPIGPPQNEQIPPPFESVPHRLARDYAFQDRTCSNRHGPGTI